MSEKGSKVEDVRLIVQHVRFKKVEGDLYIMDNRLGWMTSSSQTFKLVIAYADIKCQRISPADRNAVKLQLILHNGGQETLLFDAPEGKAKQLEDRDAAKELLQQLLPKFKSKMQVELEEKNKKLQSDPELYQLYKDLVVSGVVTPDEFWANRSAAVSKESANQDKPSTSGSSNGQKVGVSAHFLSEIKPQTDGANGMKYNLTGDVIASIFRTYPAVKARHLELVPHQVSEQDFWVKFFQSHYFHMDRIHLHDNKKDTTDSSDPFAECARLDESRLRAATRSSLPNPLLDLTVHRDDQVIEGFGEDAARELAPDGKTLKQSSSAQLIRRFNNHSLMVLRASLPEEPTPAAAVIPETGPDGRKLKRKARRRAEAAAAVDPAVMSAAAEQKRVCVSQKINYQDLQDDSSNVQTPELKLKNVDKFLQGPTPDLDGIDDSRFTSDVIRGANSVIGGMTNKRWSLNLGACCSESSALEALRDCSASGQLMRSAAVSRKPAASDKSSGGTVEQELRQLQTALNELLRHFWSCFPVSSPQLEKKVTDTRSALVRFAESKLLPFKTKVQQQRVGDTSHLEDMLDTALLKYDTWVARTQKSQKI